jgi:hypothetical protein
MKKLMTLTVILAMVLVAAVPAIAEVSQQVGTEVSQEITPEVESGDVSATFSVESTGNNSNQCGTPLQFGNVGSPQDQFGVLQDASQLDNVNVEGSSLGFLQFNSDVGDVQADGGSPMTFEPALEASCAQAAQQSSAARG